MAEESIRGIVYCLTNSAMPDLVKIGYTGSPDENVDLEKLKRRVGALYETGVPLPFDVHYAVVVENVITAENLLHSVFDHFRTNPNREFFSVDPERVVTAMKLIGLGGGQEVSFDQQSLSVSEDSDKDDNSVSLITPEVIKAMDRAHLQQTQRKDNFNFKKVGIAPKEILKFSRDPSIEAEVIDTYKIKYEGRTMSLSFSAHKILREMGIDWKRVSGTQFWMYKGKTLQEIRKEKEDANYAETGHLIGEESDNG